MAERYHQPLVAERWQDAWDRAGVFELDPSVTDPTFVLGMFPYTSGSIHMGHVRNYSITDAFARYRRMRGEQVLHPMGWDAFGLPAENAAHERETDPATWTQSCIESMREQLRELGLGYDWSRELTTCEPSYYRWNQVLFSRLYDAGLVDHRESPVNWCPSCETVLADAQVSDNAPGWQRAGTAEQTGTCWRCETAVERRSLPQWFFRTTAYTDELLAGLDELDDWPDGVKQIQRQWIGRRSGATISFELSTSETLAVFSTRPDTVYGATYLAVSPEHQLADAYTRDPEAEDRWSGEQLDVTATHPLTGETLPVWVADYVVPDVGTGAVMGVPAHNERDHSFANAHDLPVSVVVEPRDGSDPAVPFTDEGVLTDSESYDGMTSADATATLLEEETSITPHTTDRLRDWLISRQRYWGTPIPIVHCETCGPVLVPESELPVTLPPFERTKGNPLDAVSEFTDTTCPDCGDPAERETDTMDTFVDSSWYFLRFLDPDPNEAPFGNDQVDEGLPVDLYVGGDEHAAMHLLYLRFIAHALADMDRLETAEPIETLRTQGTILHGGEKMSKSVGNVVAPHEYGPETTRLFVLSAAHPAQDFEWTAADVTRAYELQQDLFSFVESINRVETTRDMAEPADRYIEREMDRTIAAVTDAFEQFRFHRAVTELERIVALISRYRAARTPHHYTHERALRTVVRLIAPLAPFLAEEAWDRLDGSSLVAAGDWPEPLQPTPEYVHERRLVGRLRSDVREIIDVAGIEEPESIVVTVAPEWMFAAVDWAIRGDDIDSFGEATDAAMPSMSDRLRSYLGELRASVDQLDPVLSAEREQQLYRQAAWLIADELDVDVTIKVAGNDTVESDIRPNRPGVTIT